MIPPEIAAGITVPASGDLPWSTPTRSSTPKTTSAARVHEVGEDKERDHAAGRTKNSTKGVNRSAQ